MDFIWGMDISESHGETKSHVLQVNVFPDEAGKG